MNKLFMLVSEEVRFAFKNRWGYKISIVSDLVVITATFILMFFFQSSLGIQHYYDVNEQTAQILYFLGFLFWQFGTLALGFCSSMISNDARSGILELEMQSGYPVWLLVFVRMIANLVLNLVIVVVLIIVFYFLSSISLKEIGCVLLTLLINLPSLFGMFGMGLLIGSVNLKEKGTNSYYADRPGAAAVSWKRFCSAHFCMAEQYSVCAGDRDHACHLSWHSCFLPVCIGLFACQRDLADGRYRCV